MMNIVDWQTLPSGQRPPEEVWCSSPEVVREHVERFVRELCAKGWDVGAAERLARVCHEILSSRFDRNAGSWKDVEGCWFHWKMSKSGHGVSVAIADRGATISVPETVMDGKTPGDIIDLSVEPREKRLKSALVELKGLSLQGLGMASGDAILQYFVPEDAPDDVSIRFRHQAHFWIHGLSIDFSVLRQEARPSEGR